MHRHLAFLALLLLAACTKKKPNAGDVCKIEDEGTIVCADVNTALRCVASRRVAISCRGPHGCTGDGQAATCDTSLGREGDACVADAPSGFVAKLPCAEDKSAVLRCRDGKLALDLRCRGPKGCDPRAMHLDRDRDFDCDRTIGAVGDACNTRGYMSDSLGACSVDGKSALACDKDKNGSFVVSQVCGGPNGCRVGHLKDSDIPAPLCDRAGFAAAAPCGKDDPDECSADATALLTCDHKMAAYTSKPCGPKEVCVHEHGFTAWCRAK
jgi:hypothetical protein